MPTDVFDQAVAPVPRDPSPGPALQDRTFSELPGVLSTRVGYTGLYLDDM